MIFYYLNLIRNDHQTLIDANGLLPLGSFVRKTSFFLVTFWKVRFLAPF